MLSFSRHFFIHLAAWLTMSSPLFIDSQFINNSVLALSYLSRVEEQGVAEGLFEEDEI